MEDRDTNLSISIKTITVSPLPVVEEIWSVWEGGRDALMAFNSRAELGHDKYHAAVLFDEEQKRMFTLNSSIFDKTKASGFEEMKELLSVIQQSVIHHIWPVTCSST